MYYEQGSLPRCPIQFFSTLACGVRPVVKMKDQRSVPVYFHIVHQGKPEPIVELGEKIFTLADRGNEPVYCLRLSCPDRPRSPPRRSRPGPEPPGRLMRRSRGPPSPACAGCRRSRSPRSAGLPPNGRRKGRSSGRRMRLTVRWNCSISRSPE